MAVKTHAEIIGQAMTQADKDDAIAALVHYADDLHAKVLDAERAAHCAVVDENDVLRRTLDLVERLLDLDGGPR